MKSALTRQSSDYTDVVSSSLLQNNLSFLTYPEKSTHLDHPSRVLGAVISPELHREIPLIHYLPPNHHHSRTGL